MFASHSLTVHNFSGILMDRMPESLYGKYVEHEEKNWQKMKNLCKCTSRCIILFHKSPGNPEKKSSKNSLFHFDIIFNWNNCVISY